MTIILGILCFIAGAYFISFMFDMAFKEKEWRDKFMDKVNEVYKCNYKDD